MTIVALKLVVIVRHLFRFNWVCSRNKWAFLLKMLFVRDWERVPTNGGVRFWVTGQKRLENTGLVEAFSDNVSEWWFHTCQECIAMVASGAG